MKCINQEAEPWCDRRNKSQLNSNGTTAQRCEWWFSTIYYNFTNTHRAQVHTGYTQTIIIIILICQWLGSSEPFIDCRRRFIPNYVFVSVYALSLSISMVRMGYWKWFSDLFTKYNIFFGLDFFSLLFRWTKIIRCELCSSISWLLRTSQYWHNHNESKWTPSLSSIVDSTHCVQWLN